QAGRSAAAFAEWHGLVVVVGEDKAEAQRAAFGATAHTCFERGGERSDLLPWINFRKNVTTLKRQTLLAELPRGRVDQIVQIHQLQDAVFDQDLVTVDDGRASRVRAEIGVEAARSGRKQSGQERAEQAKAFWKRKMGCHTFESLFIFLIGDACDSAGDTPAIQGSLQDSGYHRSLTEVKGCVDRKTAR